MSIDRLPHAEVRPTWGTVASNMTVRYLAHPALRVAFIQSNEDPDMVYVVSDEPLPQNIDQAAAMIESWRMSNGQAAP